jgi:hypothetical protein
MRFDHLREKLLQGGIAPRHVRRYLRELSDHFDDLVLAEREAGQSEEAALAIARARLGEEDKLAAAMLARPELKSWTARLPWLVFGVAPPLAMMVAFFVLGLPLGLIARLHGWMGHGMAAPDWFQIWARLTALFLNLMLSPALAILLIRMAKRRRMTWKWPATGIAVLAMAGVHMVTPFPPNHSGQIGIGVLGELAGRPFAMQGPLWGVQFLLTLAPLLWLWRAERFAGPIESR